MSSAADTDETSEGVSDRISTTTSGRHPHIIGLVRRSLRARPATTVFIVALSVRVVVVIGILLAFGSSDVFPDAGFYNQLATEAATGDTARWDGYWRRVYEAYAAFTLPLVGLYRLFGPLTWIGQLYVALLGAATAGLTTHLATEASIGRRWAVIAGAIVALLPSQVLFSSLTLKDAAVWLVLVAIGLIVAKAGRTTGGQLLRLAVGAILLLTIMRYLRLHTLVVTVWAIAIAAWFGRPQQRLLQGIGATLLLLIVPLSFELGPAGLEFIASAGSLEQRRAANASNAETAFVPDQQQLAEEQSRRSNAGTHSGDGSDTGVANGDSSDDQGQDIADDSGQGRALDTEPEGVVRDLSHLPYGIAVMLAAPFPWWGEGNMRVRMAQFAMIMWYPIVLFAIVGLFFVWRYRRAMAFPVLAGGGMLLVYGLVEGNFGTAYRHRGEFVWVVALLAAIGLKHTVNWIRERRTAKT